MNLPYRGIHNFVVYVLYEFSEYSPGSNPFRLHCFAFSCLSSSVFQLDRYSILNKKKLLAFETNFPKTNSNKYTLSLTFQDEVHVFLSTKFARFLFS